MVVRSRSVSGRTRTGHEVRLQVFAAEYLKSGGVATTAATKAGVPAGPGLKVTACRLLKEAEARGLIQDRVRQILGRWEIDIGALIEEMKAVVAGTQPSRRIVRKDRAGKVTGTQDVYDRLAALRVLANLAGAFTPPRVDDPKLRLAAILGAAIDRTQDRIKQEIAEGKIPRSLQVVRARAEALAPPIKEIRAALEADKLAHRPNSDAQ